MHHANESESEDDKRMTALAIITITEHSPTVEMAVQNQPDVEAELKFEKRESSR